jgi:hypothetical protein
MRRDPWDLYHIGGAILFLSCVAIWVFEVRDRDLPPATANL